MDGPLRIGRDDATNQELNPKDLVQQIQRLFEETGGIFREGSCRSVGERCSDDVIRAPGNSRKQVNGT